MTPFTSFVAVEETVVTDGGKPRRVDVPVEMPEGVSYEGIFGKETDAIPIANRAMSIRTYNPGFASGVVGGVPGQRAPQAPAPPAKGTLEGLTDQSRDQALKIDPSLLKATGKVMVQVWLKDASDAVLAQTEEPRI